MSLRAKLATVFFRAGRTNGRDFEVEDFVKIVGKKAFYSNSHYGVSVPDWVKREELYVCELDDFLKTARLMPINSWVPYEFIKKVER